MCTKLEKNSFEVIVNYNNDGYAVVKNKDGFCGVIDKECKFVVPFGSHYDYIGTFFGEIATVKREDRTGAINYEGKIIVPLEFDNVYDASNGLIKVERNFSYGLYNSEGYEILKPEFNYIASDEVNSKGCFIVVRLGKYGVRNSKGDVILEEVYDRIKPWKKNCWLCFKGEECKIADSRGE